MLVVYQIAVIYFVAVTMSMALAHALESPGKRRLDDETYITVQKIYYPGFTIAGIAEPVSVVGCLILLLISGHRGEAFGWILAALIALVSVHAIFWFITQPTNRVWLRSQEMGKAGSAFFGTAAASHLDATPDWKHLRHRWEYSHIARAVLASIAFLSLVIAVAV